MSSTYSQEYLTRLHYLEEQNFLLRQKLEQQSSQATADKSLQQAFDSLEKEKLSL
jgi:hypothetical protein